MSSTDGQDVKNKASETFQTMGDYAHNKKEDAKEAMSNAADNARDKAQNAKEHTQRAASDTTQTAGNKLNQAGDKLNQKSDEMAPQPTLTEKVTDTVNSAVDTVKEKLGY
eukprot:jgi/Chlat1/5872/Chrsp4S06376